MLDNCASIAGSDRHYRQPYLLTECHRFSLAYHCNISHRCLPVLLLYIVNCSAQAAQPFKKTAARTCHIDTDISFGAIHRPGIDPHFLSFQYVFLQTRGVYAERLDVNPGKIGRFKTAYFQLRQFGGEEIKERAVVFRYIATQRIKPRLTGGIG